MNEAAPNAAGMF